ncbi:MAG: hypothetical protein E7532_06770 [Ruminococcaceae bacterium]|nr:hypothetical protein [Oscillospiraceae bacterium]
MHFLFMKDLFSQYETDIRIENDIETIHIRNKQFEDEIVVHYFPDGYYTYLLCFATQHGDISSKEELIQYALSFANAEKAAIEFFENEKNSFGGEIEVSLLDNISYDELRNYFGYPHLDLTNLTFKVRAWNARYCFDGYFEKSETGAIEIRKKYVKCTP